MWLREEMEALGKGLETRHEYQYRFFCRYHQASCVIMPLPSDDLFTSSVVSLCFSLTGGDTSIVLDLVICSTSSSLHRSLDTLDRL